MRLMLRMGFVFLLVTAGSGAAVFGASQTVPPCDVTAPNGFVADGGEPAPGSFGNPKVSLGPFGLWPNGTVVFRLGGSGFVTSEGWLGMKFGWQVGVPGPLTVEGRRLDGPALPLRAESGGRSSNDVFQATYLIFPAPGCWEVTGRVGDASLTFVTRVEKNGDGPTWRREHSRDRSIVPVR
jgi:hypothetical protein